MARGVTPIRLQGSSVGQEEAKWESIRVAVPLGSVTFNQSAFFSDGRGDGGLEVLYNGGKSGQGNEPG